MKSHIREPLLSVSNLKSELTRQLENTVNERLASRLAGNPHYSENEIRRISSLDISLFPRGVRPDEDCCNAFRSLARLSQLELKPNPRITSHRRILGPLIVGLKRLTWPLVSIHLKDSFSALEEYASWVVYTLARQSSEIEKLKKSLPEDDLGKL